MSNSVLVIGSFVADAAFRVSRLPAWGETLMGGSFRLGPGGKGSNQAVAAARAGAAVQLLSRVGDDAFGALARDTWKAAGIDASLVGTSDAATGAAAILVDAERGENAIVVAPGACFTLTREDVEAAADAIRSADVVLAQLELPVDVVQRGLELAREAGAITILNPAPAPFTPLPTGLLVLVDFLIPNETEAAGLAEMPAELLLSEQGAERVADSLLELGPGAVVLTLGSRGSLVRRRGESSRWIPAYDAGPVLDTTGAGDAFCGAFAAALGRGRSAEEAAHFGSAAAGIAVTRPGTAAGMPVLAEIEAMLQH